jgi:hypothetical protein
MIVVSSNLNNLLIDFSKKDVEDLFLVLECCLDFDYSGDEDYRRVEKLVNKLHDTLDDYLDHNKKQDFLVP